MIEELDVLRIISERLRAADVPFMSEYRHAEFERRKSVEFAGISTWITSREDLILSKLVWARDTGSEMQLRDVRS